MQIILRVEKGGRGGGQEDTCNSRLCCRTAKDNCFAVSAVSTATCDNRLVGSFVLVPSPELLLLLLYSYCSCWLYFSCCSSSFYRLLLLLFLLFLLSVLAMAQHQHSGPKASLSAFLLNIYHLITIWRSMWLPIESRDRGRWKMEDSRVNEMFCFAFDCENHSVVSACLCSTHFSGRTSCVLTGYI